MHINTNYGLKHRDL